MQGILTCPFLGRRDGTTASNNEMKANIPSPFELLNSLISKFQGVGISIQDLVVLLGIINTLEFDEEFFHFISLTPLYN